MRSLIALAALALAAPLAAQQPAAKPAAGHAHAGGMHADPDKAVQGGGALPAGWSARTDRNAPMANVKVVPMGDGLHVTLGPATILWRATDAVSGPFHTLATFTQTKAPMHPEAYGLFIGGRALDGDAQQYAYFLVRGDGSYLIKRRNGAKTETLVDWTRSPAVHAADSATGKATNKLEIDAKSDPTKIRFLINGQEVHSAPTTPAEHAGIVGLRVNHNLDVNVTGFAVHK